MAFTHPKDFTKPGKFALYVEVHPNKRNGIKDPFITRIGNFHSEEGARAGIADDLKAMQETYGGLFEAAGTTSRVYRIFRATEWEEIKV